MRCYTASARRCETVEYAFKRGSSGKLGLLKGANFGWSDSASNILCHSYKSGVSLAFETVSNRQGFRGAE